mmetsp:Transcript_21022/g.51668  ORF Transcript_21022/g.51668 Transcript_21022/m.51668 type:complete len:299 (+) Transcript_21022:92-988(+)|eukprot:CAMPEP_0113628540 /NCGR_PEP_ID=MMETSP0017_2-20120614/14789_1 /TAXON_ID=2856 /ORGANISM="Cylindrotheca closterium" /LENGTH=298 /DNA_ID=CAMNT_0000538851 /DNA_START=92 /DNA_END=988 /DNA_ORIENTATION=- /assembly_acc=CAM_ASM_000147
MAVSNRGRSFDTITIIMCLMAMMMTTVTSFSVLPSTSQSTSTALDMVRTKGLERSVESATPEEGGMTLFLKAGPSPDGGTTLPVGDCPFAHAVRLVLEEKGLPYLLQPCSPDTKPEWLIDYYEGKMPALRHRKECYVESSVIMEYLEFFFSSKSYPSLKPPKKCNGEDVLDGFFPAVAQYLKDTTGTGISDGAGDDDDEEDEKLQNLRNKLQGIEDHLADTDGSFLCGDDFSLLDCRLVPQLYHLNVASQEFKSGIPNWKEDYPNLQTYYESCTSRPSFQATLYPEETIIWGWSQARS